MPYSGTNPVLTFNLINSLAKMAIRSNALFWLTVWLTAGGRGPRAECRGYWSTFLFQNDFGRGVGPRFGWVLWLETRCLMGWWIQ
jgi:hypothetical protein